MATERELHAVAGSYADDLPITAFLPLREVAIVWGGEHQLEADGRVPAIRTHTKGDRAIVRNSAYAPARKDTINGVRGLNYAHSGGQVAADNPGRGYGLAVSQLPATISKLAFCSVFTPGSFTQPPALIAFARDGISDPLFEVDLSGAGTAFRVLASRGFGTGLLTTTVPRTTSPAEPQAIFVAIDLTLASNNVIIRNLVSGAETIGSLAGTGSWELLDTDHVTIGGRTPNVGVNMNAFLGVEFQSRLYLNHIPSGAEYTALAVELLALRADALA